MMKVKVTQIFFILLIQFTLSVQFAECQDPNLPEGRSSALFIYHPASKALLLFDGYDFHPDSNRNDVWKWDGKVWKQMTAFGPDSRSLSAGALNSRNGVIQIFGGVGKGGYDKAAKGDAWSFDGSQWKTANTNNIGTRDHHEMVYADHLQAFVLYGGQNEKREFDNTTWLLKDNQFIPMNIPGPGERYHFGMAYDRYRKKAVLYGGGAKEKRDELWEFDGKAWLKISAKTTPGGRLRHNLVYSDELKIVVLHGGNGETPDITWGWDGIAWKKIANGGPQGGLQALGYDVRRKVIAAFGGRDENGLLTSRLWELKDGKWKKISDNGTWKWVDDGFQRQPN